MMAKLGMDALVEKSPSPVTAMIYFGGNDIGSPCPSSEVVGALAHIFYSDRRHNQGGTDSSDKLSL